MLGFILWVIMGALAGWLATIVMNRDEEHGSLANILIGVVGAMVGGALFRLFGGAGVTGFNLYSLLVATVGAIILLFIVETFRGRSHAHHG